VSTATRVLLTVSGRIPDDLDAQVAAGVRPRADYVAMRDAFGADLVDVVGALTATGRLGQVLYRFGGSGPLLGWFCFRRRRQYEVIVTDGEHVGLPLALLNRLFGRGGARHMMIVHILSTSKKSRLVRYAHLADLIDRYVVYCSWQRDFICETLGVAPARVLLSTFMVDTRFFDSSLVDRKPERMICSVGLERRDYPTLMRAVEGLDVRVVIAAASPWSKRADSTSEYSLPDNVEIREFDLFELRELYAQSRFVVVPLEKVEFQAGITTILEAMSMGRAVICTHTPGQTDTVIGGETGEYVPPSEPEALRTAILRLLDNEAASQKLGSRGREWVLSNADVNKYAARLADEVVGLGRSDGGRWSER